MTTANAYCLGWQACMDGLDGRYVNPYPSDMNECYDESYAWTHGFLDAMESEEGEQPEPECAGYATLPSIVPSSAS